MSLPTYDEFLAGVNQNDLAMMLSFTMGIDVRTQNAAEADALFAQAERLYGYEVLDSLSREYVRAQGGVEQRFMGVINPTAAGYVAKLAKERVILSREPLPPTEPQA